MERRNFIKGCATLCVGSVAFASIMSGCSSIYYASHEVASNKICVKKTEFLDSNKEERKFVVIRAQQLEFPICLYQITGSEYMALYMQCTHNGCELQPSKTVLLCPCHGSEFSTKGKVLSPPADEDLKQFNVTTDNETIFIQL
jgi:cytochrome b6-f complex iron-sulfur subunit